MAETPLMPRASSTRGSSLFLWSLAAALCGFPLLVGWNALHCVGWSAFVVAFIVMPGCALRAWTDRERDPVTGLFVSLMAGLACLAFAFLALAALDAREFVWILPPASAIAWFAARRKAGQSARPSLPTLETIAVLVPIAAALARAVVETPADWYLGFESDASFHVQNAIELSRRWPMADPRIAGEPLRYHFLSYTPAAAASVVLGLPVRACMLGVGAHFMPMLLALGLFAGARALGARPIAAALVSLALVLHADLGAFIGRLFGSYAAFGSQFDLGVYTSTTTTLGLCALLALLIVIEDSFETSARTGPAWILLAALSALASGSKGSVLPPLVLALAATWFVRRADRPVSARVIAVVVAAALPFTLWLVLAPDGYAQSMFSWQPVASQFASPFQARVVAAAGGDPRAPSVWATVLLVIPWCIGFLGIGALALWAWFATRVKPARAIEILLLATVVFGMVPALLFVAPGASQLFFAYDAQVCAVLLGAVATTRFTGRKGRFFVIAALAVLGLQVAAVWTRAAPGSKRAEFVGDVARYRAALEWIRTETPVDAVFLIDDPRLSASTWSERRAFFETKNFSPRRHARFSVEGGAARVDAARLFSEHERLESSFFAGPKSEDVRAIRAIVGENVPLYALRSSVHVKVKSSTYVCEMRALENSAEFGREAGLELVHDAGIVAIYRLPD